MFCKNCGEPLNDNQAICLKCGIKVGDGSSFCQNCGQPVDPNAEFCLSCGVALKTAKAGAFNENDKVKYALIAFFLGAIGIHNFMLGENKKGIMKIVFTFCVFGVGGILALIDFIKILTDSYVVDPTKFF